MLQHIVVFSTGEKPREPLEETLDRFARGIRSCPEVIDVSWGENVNPTGLERGYEFVCIATLSTIEAMKKEYWNHPAHQELLERLPEVCESRFALDYCAAALEGAKPWGTSH